jgi:hypothetical protein
MPIGHSSWCIRECDLLDLEGDFLSKGCVMAFNMKETILDDILGHDLVGLTILHCSGNISIIMIIWK